MLRPDRAARLVNQKALDPSLPGLDEVIDRLLAAGFDQEPATAYEAEVARAVGRVVVDRLVDAGGRRPVGAGAGNRLGRAGDAEEPPGSGASKRRLRDDGAS